MIERGSGRTSGLTEWRLMDLLSMWACIQDHDTAGHWKQVAGWRKVCDLAQAHLGRLKEYRRGLAEAWPPATNAAARAYLGELDDLIDKVQRTHDTAAANYDALAAATRAISSTRVELKPLHDEYVTKLQEKRTYEATLADPKAAMGSRVPDKPVTDVDLERLNAEARNLMYGLSGELQQAQVMLRQPPPPSRIPTKDPSDPDIYGSSVGAPIIPPVVPIPVSPPSTAKSTAHPSTNQPVRTPTAPNAGPVLGGVTAPTTSLPTNTTPFTPAAPAGSSASPHQASPPAFPGNLKIPRDQRDQPTPNGRIEMKGHQPDRPHSPTKPMPLGGMIGGAPGMGIAQPGSSSPRRINPVGGVIGGGGAGTSPSGAAGSRPGGSRWGQPSGMHGMPMGGSFNGPGSSGMDGRAGSQEHGDERRHWDPDQPWAVDEGVPPIVRSSDDEGPIDPGPAIGFGR
ncbi:hypothetical protein [Micromonospora rubida]